MKKIALNKMLLPVLVLWAPALIALDFLYVEDTLEYARMVSVEADVGTREGILFLEHDCASCPTQIPFNRDTRLDTPFGTDRPLQEILEWQGNPVMVHYSLPQPVATQVVIYQLNDRIDDVEVVEEEEE